MKITIDLSPSVVLGLKNYIKETTDITNPLKEDIKSEINGILQSAFQAPRSAIADHISVADQKIKKYT